MLKKSCEMQIDIVSKQMPLLRRAIAYRGFISVDYLRFSI